MQADLFPPKPRDLIAAGRVPGPPKPGRVPPKPALPTAAAALDAMEAGSPVLADALFAAMVEKAKDAGEVSGDDATLWLRANAPHVDPRFAGGVFRRKGWTFKRWKTTSITGRHTRPLRVWTWAGA